MTATIFVLEKEGFLDGIGIKLDSGLMLRTSRNMLFAHPDTKQMIINQFKEFLGELESFGFEILGRELLEEFSK